MSDMDLNAFAELIFREYGPMADLEALKRARRFNSLGDAKNAEAWMAITDKVREIQNQDPVGRMG